MENTKRIMILEDDPYAMQIVDILIDRGYEVDHACDLYEAYCYLEDDLPQETIYDAVILDVAVPGVCILLDDGSYDEYKDSSNMNGYEYFKRKRDTILAGYIKNSRFAFFSAYIFAVENRSKKDDLYELVMSIKSFDKTSKTIVNDMLKWINDLPRIPL